ncbi:hypothetical protein M758_3G093900 [Ceratodon purpureus]|nr:hypothetical protein M758_3G093900 [Ceratodon purpureus]
MGLFLQKRNLIRDYLEHVNSQPAPRRRWPREVWVKYADKLEDFKDGNNNREALLCLNEMVTDALSDGLDCLQYMASLQDPANLRFCAIPQITALGTLAMCYNNVEVFRGSVRLREGLTAKILDVKTMPDVYGAFSDFTGLVSDKIGFVLVTLPYTMSQMGFAWGSAASVLYGLIGAWCVYLLVWLYLEFKSRIDLQGKVRPENYILQQPLLCKSTSEQEGVDVHCGRGIVSSCLSSRLWSLPLRCLHWRHYHHHHIYLLARCCALLWTGVKHTGANDMVEFFSGVGNILGAYGGHGITIEILETMKRPSAYKSVNLAVFFYALLVTSPSSVAVYWSAGDILLKQSYAFAVLPSSGWQTLAFATIIAHQRKIQLSTSGIISVLYTNGWIPTRGCRSFVLFPPPG